MVAATYEDSPMTRSLLHNIDRRYASVPRQAAAAFHAELADDRPDDYAAIAPGTPQAWAVSRWSMMDGSEMFVSQCGSYNGWFHAAILTAAQIDAMPASLTASAQEMARACGIAGVSDFHALLAIRQRCGRADKGHDAAA